MPFKIGDFGHVVEHNLLANQILSKANSADVPGIADGVVQDTVPALVTSLADPASGSTFSTALSNTIAEAIDAIPEPLAVETTRLAPLSRITKASAGPFRILVGGTSIAEDSRASTRMIIEQLLDTYGDSGVYTVRAGFMGGSTANVFGGWNKQPFGGALFTRLRGAPGAAAVSMGMAYGNEIVVFWSQEADTGVSDVLVDGVVVGQIGTAGAQQYRKSTTFAVTLGPHVVTIAAPATGYTYIEDVEFRSTARKGIEAVYAALGGSMLRNSRVLAPLAANQVAGIPIVGMAGVDSISNRSAVDVAIYQWVVNDSGFNQGDNFTQEFKPAMDQIVANHAALGTPMVVVIEMGGHYSLPNGGGNSANYDRFNIIRNYLLSLRTHAHVTVIDWHGATIDTDLARYAARYYPTALNLNVAAGTFTGDFIHPNDAAHAILHALMAEAFGLTPPRTVTPRLVTENRLRVLPLGKGNDKLATVAGAAKRFAVPSGAAVVGLATASSSAYQSRVEAYYRDAAASSARLTTVLAEIAASANSTEHGKYVDWTQKAVGLGTEYGVSDRGYLTIKASGNFVIRADTPVILYTPEGQELPRSADTRTYLNYSMLGTEPLVFTIRLGASATNGNLYISGRVYDIGLAKSDVPLLPA